MTEPDTKRRSSPRYEVSGMEGNLHVPIEIRILNLSPGGMALETHSYLQFGRAYTLELESESRSLSLVGTVAWCSLEGTSKSGSGEVVPVYRAGLRFAAASGERARELWSLIRSHTSTNEADGVLGRLRLELPAQTQLESSYDFAVRSLSLSGMLIETDFEPEVGSTLRLHLVLGRRRWETMARVASVPRPGRRGVGQLTQIGLGFCSLEPDQRTELEAFIDTRLK